MNTQRINIKGIIGAFAFLLTSSALNMTSGILAYIMITYPEVAPTNVAMLLTIPAIVGTFVAFVSGTAINRFGTRKITLFAHSTQFISGMIFLLFGNKSHIFVLYIAAALYGFSLGTANVLQAQLLRENISDEGLRGQFLGYASAVKSVGGVAISTLGGIIAAINDGAHWERAYLLYLFMILMILVELICLPKRETKAEVQEEKKEKSSEKLPLKVWLISAHYLLYFLFLYVFSLNISEYVITTHALGTSAQAGLCLSVMTVGGIVSGMIYGTYSRALKNWTMPVLLAISCVGCALIVFIPNLYVLYTASFLLGVAMMGTGPYVTIELSKITTPSAYTKAMSVYSGFTNGGMMFAVYILAALSAFFFGTPDSVDGKFIIALAGNLFVFVSSIPLFALSKNK